MASGTITLDARALDPPISLDPGKLDPEPVDPAALTALEDFHSAVTEYGATPHSAAEVLRAQLSNLPGTELTGLPGVPITRGARVVRPGPSPSMQRFAERTGMGDATFPGQPTSGDLLGLMTMAGIGQAGKLAQAATNPVVKRSLVGLTNALGGYFAYEMGRGALDSTKRAFQSLQQGDIPGAVREMGAAGIQGFFGYHGGKEALRNGTVFEPRARYEARQSEAPPSQRDIGAGGRRGPLEPEIVPTAQPQAKPVLRTAAEPIELRPSEVTPRAKSTPEQIIPAEIIPASEEESRQAAIEDEAALSQLDPQEAAQLAAQPAPPTTPGTLAEIPVAAIHVDPARFQFKANTGQGGAGEELRDVEKFDPEKSGVIAVWRDPANGETYVVNGHHRLELAQRTGTETIAARYLDAPDARAARVKGALINIAEGRGESTDAAKIFRDGEFDEAGLAAEGVSLKGKVASEGLALAKLDPNLFRLVVSGDLPAARGAVIGAGLPEHTDQRALFDVLAAREKSGKRLTNDQVGEMIRLATAGPKRTDVQESLFGDEEVTRSLIAEKAEVSDFVRKQLTQEKRLFGTVGTVAAADRLGERGNVIQAEGNAAVAEQASQAQAIYDKLSARAGDVATTLDNAASALAEGEPAHEVKQRAYREIRQALLAQVGQLQSPAGSLRGAPGLDPTGTREAGQGQHSLAAQEEVKQAAVKQAKLAKLQAIEQEARERMAKRGTFHGTKLNAGLPLDDLADLAVIGAAKLARGANSFSTWSQQMLQDVGAGVKRHLLRVYQRAKTLHARYRASKFGSERGSLDLFGSDETSQAAAASKRDANQLRGDQLTAQFKSGMAKKQGRLAKPEEQQTSFFEETPEQPQGKLFGSERGSLPLRAPGPRANYSGLGAVEDVTVRNLSQLEKADLPAHAAAVRAAASRGQTAVLLRAAVPRIEAALGPDGPTWKEMRAALVESRLRGIRARWMRMAKEAEASTPDRMRRAVDGGLFELLEQIDGKRGIPQDVSQTAAALYQQTLAGELRQEKPSGPAMPIPSAGPAFETLRSFLAQTFADAAQSTATILDDDTFGRITQHPHFGQGLATYKEILEAPMAANHALNEGVFSSALGPLGTYYPLVPVTQAEAATANLLGRATPYRKPKNIANDFATGLAQNYDLEMEALKNRLERAVKANNKAALIQILGDRGLLRVLKPNERAGDAIEIAGQQYTAKVVEVSANRAAVMPAWLATELEPILDQRGSAPGLVKTVVNALNTFSLVGPLDLTFHSTNLIGTMVANTPFLPHPNKALASLSNLPFTKLAAAVIRIANTDPTTAEAIRDLHHMAQLGLVPDKFGSETYSRRYAEQTGAHLELKNIGPVTVPIGFSPLLYGPKGLDVRARLAMYRIGRQIDPKISDRELAKFVNQLGTYVHALQGSIERTMKGTGLSPFYTAGSTMMRNGVNAFLGRGPITSNRFSFRAAQQLTGGAVGMIALWTLAYRAYRDKWPWQEKEAKLLQIPVKASDRATPAGRALYGTKKGTAYVNFAFFNPLVSRGARALGVQGAFEAAQLGGNKAQLANSAVTGAVNSLLHPAAGPLAKAGAIVLTGYEPSILSMQPFLAYPQARTIGERPVEAARALNNFFADVADASGLGKQPRRSGQEQGNRWLRMATDVTLPRLFGTVSDQEAKSRRLATERRTATRTARRH